MNALFAVMLVMALSWIARDAWVRRRRRRAPDGEHRRRTITALLLK